MLSYLGFWLTLITLRILLAKNTSRSGLRFVDLAGSLRANEPVRCLADCVAKPFIRLMSAKPEALAPCPSLIL